MSNLFWSPLIETIREHKSPCNLLIAPFIQSKAITQLLANIEVEKLRVITSWTARNLASGVSDPDVFSVLEQRDIPLYTNPDIHLKLLVFDENTAFHTSGNITSRGLGLGKKSNVEIGCYIKLNLGDWIQVNELLNASSRVDFNNYQIAKRFSEKNRNAAPPLPPLHLETQKDLRQFSRQSLPQSESPEQLWIFYTTGGPEKLMAACVHDLWLYNVPLTGLSRSDFFETLSRNFTSHPFIVEIVSMIKSKGSLRFGAVNEWITQNCTDKPTPTRWEIKPTTNRLYNWLSQLITNISWSKPNYSQVLHWNKKTGES